MSSSSDNNNQKFLTLSSENYKTISQIIDKGLQNGIFVAEELSTINFLYQTIQPYCSENSKNKEEHVSKTSLTSEHYATLGKIIDKCARRGVFVAEEMLIVGVIYQTIKNIVSQKTSESSK